MFGTFKKISPPKSIHFSLKYESMDEHNLTVKITLLPLGAMTAIHLLVDTASEGSLEISKNQWPGMLSQLKTLLETGKGLPWPQTN